MKDLIAKLEAATGPDRIMDAEIHRAITGMTYLVTARTPPVFEDRSLPPLYTSSIDAALTLVPEGAEKSLSDLYGEARAEVGLNFHEGPFTGEHKGGSLAIALSIAALRARDGGRG